MNTWIHVSSSKQRVYVHTENQLNDTIHQKMTALSAAARA